MAARAEEVAAAVPDSPPFDSAEAVKLWLSERFAHETDPTAILRTVAETLGRFLGVSRVGYGEIEPGEDWITIPLDWTDGIATMVGRRPLMRHTRMVQEYMRGRTLVVPDIEALALEEDQRASLRATDTRAFVAVPLLHDGEFVALFACNHHEPRAWEPAEVELIQQTGARVWSALQHARTIARLRESEEQFRQLADNIPALCWLADAEGAAIWGNRAYLDYFGASDPAAVTSVAVVHPDDLDRALAIWADGVARGTPVETVVRLRGVTGDYRPFLSRANPIRDAAGHVTRWTAVMVDLTEQRARDEHKPFFDALADAIREETDSARILTRVGDMLKAYLGASRVMYSEVDPADPMAFVVHREAADPALADATGRYRFSEKFAGLYARLAAGETIAWDRLEGPGAPPPAVRDFFRQTGMPAAINVPLVKDGRLVAMLSAHSPVERAWTAAERALMEDVAERTWSTVTRARAEAELKERERTQAFLVAWTDRLRGEQDPAALLDVTLEQLGRHLGVNRAVYSEIRIDGGDYTIVSEWCRGVATVRGLRYPASNLSDVVRDAYLAGETVASDDLPSDTRYSAIARAKFAEVAVVARIGVPLTRDGRTQAILAVDTDHPRKWTEEEVQLVREVAERTWTLLQQARAEAALKRREREQALLLAWSDRVRGETRPEAVIATTLALAGEHLGITRVGYMEADPGDPRLFTVLDNWTNGVAPMSGRPFSLDWIGEDANRRFLAGESVCSEDVRVQPGITAPAQALYSAGEIVAVLSVPLVRDGAVHAVLSASHRERRTWSEGDRRLLRELADRMWSMLERTRAEAALQQRERDQAFLLEWNDAVRRLGERDAIIAATVAAAGRHFGVTRVTYAEETTGDPGRFTIVADACDGVPSIAGNSYALDAIGDDVADRFLAGDVVVHGDIPADPAIDPAAQAIYAATGVAAMASVPLVRDGRVRAVLSANHAAPRPWHGGEVALLHELGDRLWAMLERAHAEGALKERERHQAFLLDWVDRLRGEGSPERLVALTLERLADYLGVARANFAAVRAGGFAIVQEVGGAVPGTPRRDGVSDGVHAAYLAGATVVCEDVGADPRFDAAATAHYRAVDAVAFIGVPMVRRGVVHGVLSVQVGAARRWAAGEVQLLRDVADRLLVTIERARAEREIKARERDQALLIEWSDRIRGEREASAIVASTLALLGRHLDLNRATYAEPDGELFTIKEEWREGVSSVRGNSFLLPSVGQAVDAAWRAGEIVRFDDVAADPRLTPEAVDRYRGREIAAFVSVPLVREGTLCSALSVQSARPRTWQASEVELIREVAERTWVALARARTEAALAARERDQAFLLAWSDRLRQLTDPAEIMAQTLDELIAHLAVDRATYAESDPDGDLFTIMGASGSDRAEIGETYRLSDASPAVARIWRAGGAIRYDEVIGHPRVTAERAAFYARLKTRAFLSVPLFTDGTTGGTLSVQSATPRAWQDSEEQLVREVAERLWSTLQRARANAALAARERDQAFLLTWSDRLRQLTRPETILDETLVLLNAHLGATRSAWAESDAAGEEMAVLAASDGRVDADERYRLADVPASVRAAWLAGGAIRYDDLTADPRVSAERVGYYAQFGIRAFLSVPLTIDGVVRATLSVRCGAARAWTDDEEQLIRDVAERLWIALERARATAALGARERDQAFLLEWGDRLREEHEPAAILAATLAAVGDYLAASRATFAQADASGRTFTVVDDWCRDIFSLAGTRFAIEEVGYTVERGWSADEIVRYDDVATDPRLEPERVPAYLQAEIAAFVSVPLLEGGQVRCIVSVQSRTPRTWQESELALLRTVAERTWIILERARVQQELAAQQRVQTFLIGWSDRVRQEASPHAILALTLETLGRQLGATRANYAECDPAVTQMTVIDTWGLHVAPTGTVFPMTALGLAVVADSLAGRTLTVSDTESDPRFADVRELYRGVQVRAVVTVPLVRAGRLIAVLSVQQDQVRHWTPHEIRLIEEVADRTWSVLERAHSETRLAESEAQLSAFLENAPIAMYLKDRDGRYTRMNRQMELVLGAPMDEAIGETTYAFMPAAVADEVTRLDQLALAGGAHEGEIVVPGRDLYNQAMTLRFPMAGADGRVERIGGFVIDVTARKRAEAALEQSREALFQTEKLSALGSLLAGVSHELNNPLSIVVAQAVMMERQAKDTPLAERAFKIRKAADRCARIVQTFLAMARQKRPERAPVDLNNVVAAALELAEYGLRSDGIAVTRRLDPALPRIAADADQLHQIIVNLLVNAQHAMNGLEGERAITIATAPGPEPQTVVLDVADTGPGIPEEVARRIFEPFFTTKPQGEGTGVGLSFSQGLAEAHGGRLSLLPSERGACFRLTLPLDADGVLATAAPETIAAIAPRKRRALVIDDEAEIAEALADFLALEGYVTDVAVGGRAGKAKLTAGDYDLVVSDLRMPELDGPELYRWLQETRPRLAERVAFTTGDTLGSAVARFLAEAKRPVLEKPFVPEAVRRFLDQMEQP